MAAASWSQPGGRSREWGGWRRSLRWRTARVEQWCIGCGGWRCDGGKGQLHSWCRQGTGCITRGRQFAATGGRRGDRHHRHIVGCSARRAACNDWRRRWWLGLRRLQPQRRCRRHCTKAQGGHAARGGQVTAAPCPRTRGRHGPGQRFFELWACLAAENIVKCVDEPALETAEHALDCGDEACCHFKKCQSRRIIIRPRRHEQPHMQLIRVRRQLPSSVPSMYFRERPNALVHTARLLRRQSVESVHVTGSSHLVSRGNDQTHRGQPELCID